MSGKIRRELLRIARSLDAEAAKRSKCTRTACEREGAGLVHVDLIKSQPNKYINYCRHCMHLINGQNNKKLIMTAAEAEAINSVTFPF